MSISEANPSLFYFIFRLTSRFTRVRSFQNQSQCFK